MNLESIHKKAAQLLATAKEREEVQQCARVMFYLQGERPPELAALSGGIVDDVPTPSDNPPAVAPFRVYLPIKQQLI